MTNYKERDLLRRLETVSSKIKTVSDSKTSYDVWILHWLERLQRQLVALYEAQGEYNSNGHSLKGDWRPRRGRWTKGLYTYKEE